MLPWIFKKKYLKKIATVFAGVLFVVVFLFLANSVSAQVANQNAPGLNLGLKPVQDSIALADADIRLIIARIIRAVLGLLGILAVCIIIWAGYTIMTAGGNEEKIGEGKKILVNAVIGLIIILSAFSIAQFVINALARATGLIQEEKAPQIKFETFAGSGALGKIIKDHYPARNQVDVVRNTKIVITFAEPINPESFIENTNETCWDSEGVGPTSTCESIVVDGKNTIRNPYYGDCILGKTDFDWERDCDHLKSSNEQINIYRADDLTKVSTPSAAMATYDADKNAYTFVFRPFQPLGDQIQKLWYNVHIGNGINKKSGVPVFDGQYYKFYDWQFKTDTVFDFSPPTVISVHPKVDAIEPRNTILQVNFSEAVDPMMVQGAYKPLDSHYSFSNIVFGTSTVSGRWQLTNGYKTAEFTSDQECGLNSCGQQMYCLPVFCANNFKCTNDYSILIRTAQRMSGDQTFVSVPFSGVMDIAGNALDGNKNERYDEPPAEKGVVVDGTRNFKLIGLAEKNAIGYLPDNYGWNFKIENTIDRVAPYITKVLPGPDTSGVAKDAALSIYFNKLIRLTTINNGVGLLEYRVASSTSGGLIDPIVDNIALWTRAIEDNDRTVLNINHREFGPNGKDFYYFPSVSSSVQSINQNCLYPGYGPNAPANGTVKDYAGDTKLCTLSNYDESGNPGSKAFCVDVNNVSSTDTGCVHTYDRDTEQATSDVGECLKYLKQDTVSVPFRS